jgi:hypothetical protein
MSMIGKFAALPADRFALLRTDPSALDDYLFPDTGDYPDAVHSECDFLDVGKAWHGLHYLIAGTAWDTDGPLGLAVLGGEECGLDTGYGRPHCLDVSQVQAVAAALAAFALSEALARFSLAALDEAEIYPGYWQEEADRVEWVVGELGYLTAFYRGAAAQGKVVIKYF